MYNAEVQMLIKKLSKNEIIIVMRNMQAKIIQENEDEYQLVMQIHPKQQSYSHKTKNWGL